MIELYVYISSYEYTICYCRARRRPMVDVAVILHTVDSTDRKMKISKSIRYLTPWIKILKSKRPRGEREK